jgi:OFA family oxalate/formate antiporter-like MFS transporter
VHCRKTGENFLGVTDLKTKIFYGWIVLLCASLILFATSGIQFSFGVFFKPISNSFAWPRSATSGIFSLYMIMRGIFSFLMGALSDRFSARLVVASGGLLLSAGLISTSRANDFLDFLLFYGIFCGCGAGSIYSPLAATLSRWFKKKRGMALGIFSAGIGLGTLAFSPLAHFLISEYTWRDAYLILGIVAAIVIVFSSFLIVDRPETMHLLPNGDNDSTVFENKNVISMEEGISFRMAIAKASFWQLFAINIIAFFAVFAVMVHLVPIATDRGVASSTGANCLAVIGMIGIFGRFLMGTMGDKRSPEGLLGLALLLQGAMILYLIFVREAFGFYSFAIIFGFGYGGTVPLLALVTAKQYGPRSMGSIYGALQFIGVVAGAIGPLVAGYLYDISSKYTLALLVSGMSSFVAGYLSFVLGRPEKPNRKAPQ